MPSEIVSGQTTEGLPVAPSLGPSLSEARVPPERALVDGRVVYICVHSIGTGGPFGAEGPIIATGGAVGWLVGQLLHTTAVERKTLLAAGAAAGMDLLAAHRRRLDETHVTEQNLSWWPRG